MADPRTTTLRYASEELHPTIDSSDNDQIYDVLGNKEDTAASDSVIGLSKNQLPQIGAGIAGRAVTATLYVSPNGSGEGGKTWRDAYTTIQAALDAASTDVNECTLILVGINTGSIFYDIDTTGDPTYEGNYIIKGTHRTWQKIKNTNSGATSVLKFTGYTALIDININLGDEDVDGVIFTKGASRCYNCQFIGEDLTGLADAVRYEGDTLIKHHRMKDCTFRGNKTYMTGIRINNSCCSGYFDLVFHDCLTAVQILDDNSADTSDDNFFKALDIGNCTTGINIETGNKQHFQDITFHGCDINIDDEVGDHIWDEIKGDFPITILPTDLVGTTLIADAAANVYGLDTELRAAALSTKPFRIVGILVEPVVAQWYQIRLSADSGSTFFDQIMVQTARSAGSSVPSGTSYIFNKGTRISGSVKAESDGSDQIKVWLKIQEM